MRALGADHVIDYTKEDFTKSGKQYDLILAVNGYHPLSGLPARPGSPGEFTSWRAAANAQIFQALLLGPFYTKNGGRKMVGVIGENQAEGPADAQRAAGSGQNHAGDRPRLPAQPGGRSAALYRDEACQRESGRHGGRAFMRTV